MERSTYLSLLKQKGFTPFLSTQFLGALNDNLLKWVIIFLAGAGLSHGTSGKEAIDLRNISLAFILPSLIFTGLAGYLADNFNKRKVLIFTKAFEIGTMGLAWAALRSSDFHLQLAVLFLLATQFTFFGPAKYGILPELVDNEGLSRANGLLEMSTFLAIILGSILAAPLFAHFKSHIDTIALVFMGLAVLGSLFSLGIGPVPEAQSRQPLRVSLLWSEVILGTREMLANRRLWLTNLGIAFFWFLGTLFQLSIVLLVHQTLHEGESAISALNVWLAVGIGVGSMLAGRWSGDKVELGLVPLGCLGMGVSALALTLCATSLPGLVPYCLGAVGLSAGLFAVPLNASCSRKPKPGPRAASRRLATFSAPWASSRQPSSWAGWRTIAPPRASSSSPAWPASP
jgi:acyl-[acyl-carrier-protein]-phospholipid O-acyltransferase/long-chain-fatty-acid--[acyl-carrier-protein] ligase